MIHAFTRILSHRSPIGLDIGSTSISAVQLSAPGRPVVAAALVIPRITPGPGPLSDHEASLLASALHRHGFTGSSVVIALGHTDQTIVPLQLPPVGSPAPRHEMALAQAADAARADAGDLQLAWWDLPARGPGPALALGIAATSTRILEHIAPLEAAGLDPLAVDSRALALARALRPLAPDAPALTAILDLGHSAASLVLVEHATVVYERTLPDLGLRKPLDLIAQSLDDAELALPLLLRAAQPATPTDPPLLRAARDTLSAWRDDLTRETALSLAYASPSDAHTASLFLTGGGRELPALAQHLASALPNTTTLTPTLADSAATPIHLAALSPAPLLALGLALHEPAPLGRAAP